MRINFRKSIPKEIKNIADLHCHIIPEFDDGPQSIEESVAMIRLAMQEGISTIVSTSHCSDLKNIDKFVELRDSKLNTLRDHLKEEDIYIKIIKGAEVYIGMNLFDSVHIEQLTLGDTKYMLIEFPMHSIPLFAEEFFYRLLLRGYVPIIAHPERNEQILRTPELLHRFVDLGALAQLTGGSITGYFGHRVQRCAHTILNNEIAHIVATDSHNIDKRKPIVKECIKKLNSWVGETKTRDLVLNTPLLILSNKNVDI